MGDGAQPKSPTDKVDNTIPARKKKKMVRRKKLLTLAVGDGVSMDEILSYVERALVGPVRGRNLNQDSLNKWVANSSGSILSPLSEVTKLVKCWFMVLLPSKKEADTILKRNWEMVGVPIIL